MAGDAKERVLERAVAEAQTKVDRAKKVLSQKLRLLRTHRKAKERERENRTDG